MSTKQTNLPKTTLHPEGFYRLPDVLKLIPISRSAWWAGVKSGRYPKPYRLGPRTTAWRVEDIRQLLTELSGTSDR